MYESNGMYIVFFSFKPHTKSLRDIVVIDLVYKMQHVGDLFLFVIYLCIDYCQYKDNSRRTMMQPDSDQIHWTSTVGPFIFQTKI